MTSLISKIYQRALPLCLSFVLGIFIIPLNLQAQDLNPVTWTAHLVEHEDSKEIVFTADVQEGWYLYSQHVDEGGPIPTSFELSYDGENYAFIEAAEHSKYKLVKMDEMFQMELTKYKKQVMFNYTLEEAPIDGTINARVEFMCCDDMQCLAPKTEDLTINLK